MADKFTKTLSEAGFSGLGKVTGKNRWRARIVKVGTGATGVYTENALRDTGPAAFPSGTKINADHAGFEHRMEQPAGSVKTLIGALVSEPIYVMDEALGVGTLEAEVEFSDEWAPFVEQFSEVLGLSLHAEGWGTEYNEMGLPIVEGFIPSPLNTVDLVTVAGAGGKLIELMESFKADSSDKMVFNDSNRKDDGMKPEEIQALVEKMTKDIVDALRPEPVQTEAPTASEISEAIVAANLPESARKRVYKAIESGIELTEAIGDEQKYIKELSESFKSEAKTGDVRGAVDGFDFTVGGWN